MTMIRILSLFLCLSATVSAVADSFPFMMIRFRGPQTDGGPIWNETVEMLKTYRPACDEVWFSTGIGYPPLAWHREQSARLAAAAKDVRSLGIEPGLQFQATLGHGDDISALEDTSAKTWGGFTGPSGRECRLCSCPRQPAFLAYVAEMGRIYAAWKPSSVWIDDDLRLTNHRPATDGAKASQPGCFCTRCLADFSKEEGRVWTRSELAAALMKDPDLASRWEKFSFSSLADIARAIAKAVIAVSPETRMGYQHCLWKNNGQLAVYRALSEVSKHKVRSRPGGGAYFDHNPYDQVDKSYFLSRQMKSLGGTDLVDQWCPEIETCPRTFACRTGRGLLIESMLHLAQGMNALSFLIIDSHYETPAWYGKTLLRPLAEASPFFREYVRFNEGTRPGGLALEKANPPTLFASAGIPLCAGMAYPCGTMLTASGSAALSDADIRRILSGGVLLDGAAAAALVKRGFASELGGLSVTAPPPGCREYFTDDPLNAGLLRGQYAGGPSFSLAAAAPGVRVLGRYINCKGAIRGNATLLLPTASGGRVAVFGCAGFDGRALSGNRLRQLHRAADWVSAGRLPVVLEDPAQCVVIPRVTSSGVLRSVMVLNTSIDFQCPVRVLLRGVAEGQTSAVWQALGERPVTVPLIREGKDVRAVLPTITAWNAGWLKL